MTALKQNGKRLIEGIVLLMLLLTVLYVAAAPAGPEVLYNRTENVSPAPALELTTAGGTFTTLLLNVTSQTPRWKAYVGNVSGILTLDDSSANTLYDWSLSSIAGEVYTSRSSSVNWSSIQCVPNATVFTEQNSLNISNGTADSINMTFNHTVHKSFLVGDTNITRSSCRSLVTYVNGTKQVISETTPFQEVLLGDGADNVIYTAILEENKLGFDNETYDFQMIVPEDQFLDPPSTYYFWVELI